jgi:hypothetical protein
MLASRARHFELNSQESDMADTAGAFPFPTADSHPAHPVPESRPVEQEPSEPALDHGIEESFPASDPVSVAVSKVVPKPPKAEPSEAKAPTVDARPKAPGLAHALSKGTLVGFSASFAVGLALGRMMGHRARTHRS